MKKKMYIITAVLLIITLIATSTACAKTDRDAKGKDGGKTVKSESADSKKNTSIKVKVGKKTFKAVLYRNKSTKKLLRKFPLKMTMSELNGNEKYKYLNYSLPTKEKKVKKIKAGDIMLYGDDCIVIFYKSFKTSYSYTKLGRITNPKKLAKAAGRGQVKVKFSK